MVFAAALREKEFPVWVMNVVQVFKILVEVWQHLIDSKFGVYRCYGT